MREAYRHMREYSNKAATRTGAAKLGWPRWVILKRGRELNLARTRETPWSEAEERLLEKYSGLGIRVIASKFRLAGFHRTETAISLKAKRNKIRETPNFVTKHGLANAFGVDDHKVAIWIKNGWLRAGWKGTKRNAVQRGDTFAIHRDDIRKFILNHPEEIELANVEKYWFIDIVSGGRICEAFRREAA